MRKYGPWSFLAVKTMVPVSSPIRHSAIRVWRRWCDTDRPFCKTVLEERTLATRVWPLVPGLSWSTLMKTGFLSPGFALLCCGSDSAAAVAVAVVVVVAVAIAEILKSLKVNPNPRISEKMKWQKFLSLFWSGFELLSLQILKAFVCVLTPTLPLLLL